MKFSIAALLDKVLAMTPTGARTFEKAPRLKLEFYATLVEGMADAAAALDSVPEIHPVLLLAETAVALRTADCKVRAAAADFDPASCDDAAQFYTPPVAEDAGEA